jgi:diguanylate cyclase (GGDEF)-like protein
VRCGGPFRPCDGCRLNNTLTIVLIAVIAALGVCVVVLGALVLGRRSARDADDRVAAAVAEMNERMDTMLDELTGALERAEEEGHRTRTLSELAGTIDFDEVLSRTLDTAAALAGVDAALVSLHALGPKPFVATIGLSEHEAEQPQVVGPPDGRPVRSVQVQYDYPDAGDSTEEGAAIHAGLAVPLSGEAGEIGYLTVYSRSRVRSFGEDDVLQLEALAGRAGLAIENAYRFREARQLADLDALTGLHNRRYFHETLQREVARARRYSRRLALIVFDLDDFKAVNDRIGHLAGDAVLAEAADRVRSVVRTADIACRVGGDEFAVILPESTLEDADQLYRRLLEAVYSRPIGGAGRLQISAGIAEVRDDEDATRFFQRGDDALYQAKEAGKGQVAASNTLA